MPRAFKRFADIFNSEKIIYYLDHPVEFVEDIIFADNAKIRGGKLYLSDQQKQALNALVHSKRISIRSGRGIGKTSLDSFIIIWFLCTRSDPKVIVTAPTAKQLNNQLWPEIDRWLKQSAVRELFVWTNRRVYLRESPSTWFTTSVTSDTPEGVQGSHAEHLLILADEASGIPDPIFNTLLGSMTEEDNVCVLTGNPTQTSGLFFDTHNKSREQWTCFHFNSEDSPFVTDDFIKEFEVRYGRDHQMYKVHVLGEFPSGSPDAFISLETVERAVMRDINPSGSDIQVGVDVAHFGDDLTAIAWRWSNKVYPVETKNQTSVPDVTGLVLKKIMEIRAITGCKETIKVCVDSTGVGAGVSDELALDRNNNIEVVPVNFGSSGNEQYEYMCSVLWGNIRERIEFIQLPDDDQLIAELSTRRYKITTTGKIRIEPKREYKKDYDRSPDRADAVILCFANVSSENRAIREFDHLDKSMVCDLSTRGFLSSGERHCSIFFSRNRCFSVLFCNWVGSKLYIVDEYFSDETVSGVVNVIKPKEPFSKISGNERMFGSFGDDVSSQFRKYNTSIFENYRYDEAGAIELLNIMVGSRTVIIDSRCTRLITQLRRWNFKEARNKLEDEYGMCYSLLNILSELRDKIQPKEIDNFIPAYSKIKDKVLKDIGKGGIKFKKFLTL